MVEVDIEMPKSCSECPAEYFDAIADMHRCSVLKGAITSNNDDRMVVRKSNCPIVREVKEGLNE